MRTSRFYPKCRLRPSDIALAVGESKQLIHYHLKTFQETRELNSAQEWKEYFVSFRTLPEKDKRHCITCGALFQCRPASSAKFCSTACAGVSRRHTYGTCSVCGNELHRKQNTCSYQCARASSSNFNSWIRREWHSVWHDDERHHWSNHPIIPNYSKRKKWARYRRRKTPQWMRYHMSKAFTSWLKRGTGGKKCSVSKYLGMTMPQFREYMQEQFTGRMNWNNHGTLWHIDHIIPLASGDPGDEAHNAKVWHYSNMRPLDAAKNMAKKDDIHPCQPELLINLA